jgi:hypothetical protein
MKCKTFETCIYQAEAGGKWQLGYCLDDGKHILDLGGDEVVDVYVWERASINDPKWSFDISRRMDGTGVQITNVQERYSSVLATDFSQIELRLLATSPKDMESLQRDCNAFVRRLNELKHETVHSDNAVIKAQLHILTEGGTPTWEGTE